MIVIVDYGMGNLRSVQKAFEFVGYDAVVSCDKNLLEDCSHIVLPGVGAFKDAIAALRKDGLDEAIIKQVKKGKPFLGICLGMQMLFAKSYEDGEFEGLGLVGGCVKRFETKLKVPHIGWNSVRLTKKTPLFDNINDKNFYFVHSYHAADVRPEDAETVCNYGYDFVASVNKDNIWGVQFHPEKSGDTGLRLLKNFGEIV